MEENDVHDTLIQVWYYAMIVSVGLEPMLSWDPSLNCLEEVGQGLWPIGQKFVRKRHGRVKGVLYVIEMFSNVSKTYLNTYK